MRTAESLLKTRVNAGLYRISGNFNDDITATENNIMLMMVVNSHHT
jgi:hypothetical protein